MPVANRAAPLLDDESTTDLACETLYRFLAAALSHPRGLSWSLMRDERSRQFATACADFLCHEYSSVALPLGFGELPVDDLDLRPVLTALPATDQAAADEFARVFGLIPCRECPPYEAEYLSVEDTFFRTQQMADVAGFYRAFGLDSSLASRERPDHLCLELEFSAFLLMKLRDAAAGGDEESLLRAEICRKARRSFFADHFGWWTPAFAVGLRRKAETGFYAALGKLLAAFLPIERQRLGVRPSLTPREPTVVDTAEECDGCPVQLSGTPN